MVFVDTPPVAGTFAKSAAASAPAAAGGLAGIAGVAGLPAGTDAEAPKAKATSKKDDMFSPTGRRARHVADEAMLRELGKYILNDLVPNNPPLAEHKLTLELGRMRREELLRQAEDEEAMREMQEAHERHLAAVRNFAAMRVEGAMVTQKALTEDLIKVFAGVHIGDPGVKTSKEWRQERATSHPVGKMCPRNDEDIVMTLTQFQALESLFADWEEAFQASPVSEGHPDGPLQTTADASNTLLIKAVGTPRWFKLPGPVVGKHMPAIMSLFGGNAYGDLAKAYFGIDEIERAVAEARGLDQHNNLLRCFLPIIRPEDVRHAFGAAPTPPPPKSPFPPPSTAPIAQGRASRGRRPPRKAKKAAKS